MTIYNPKVSPLRVPVLDERGTFDEPGYSEFGKGVKRFVAGVSPTIDRAQASFQSALGFDEAAAANMAEARAAEATADPRLAPRVSALRDVHSVEDFGDYLAGGVGENLPLMGTILAGGGVAGTAAKAVGAGPKVAKAATIAGRVAPYEVASVAESNQNLLDDPNAVGTDQEKHRAALLAGTAKTAVGMAGLETALGKFAGKGASMGRRVLQGGATGAAGEGATEAVEGSIDAFTRSQYNPDFDPFSKDEMWNRANEFVLGAAIGAPTAMLAGAAQHPTIAALDQQGLGRSADRTVQKAIREGKNPADAVKQFLDEHSDVIDPDVATALKESADTTPFAAAEPQNIIAERIADMEANDELNLKYSSVFGKSHDQLNSFMDDLSYKVLGGEIDATDPTLAGILDDPVLSARLQKRIDINRDRFEADQNQQTYSDQTASDELAGLFNTDKNVAESQGLSVDEPTASEYVFNRQGKPWKSLEASKRDSKKEITDTIGGAEKAARRLAFEALPAETQAEFWKTGKKFTDSEQDMFRVEPLSKKYEAEAKERGVDAQQHIVDSVRDQYLPGVSEAEALQYAQDHEVLVQNKMPAALDPADTMDLTKQQTHQKLGANDQVALSNIQQQLKDIKEQHKEALFEGFSDSDKNAVQEYVNTLDVLEKKPSDKTRQIFKKLATHPAIKRYRERQFEYAGFNDVEKELAFAAKNIERSKKPIVESPPKGNSKVWNKRIQVQEWNGKENAWVDKVVDPMQLGLAMHSKIDYSPDKVIDIIAERLHAGLASLLGGKNHKIKLKGPVNPDTVVYTFDKSKLELTYGALQATGPKRYRMIKQHIVEQAQGASDEKKAQLRIAYQAVNALEKTAQLQADVDAKKGKKPYGWNKKADGYDPETDSFIEDAPSYMGKESEMFEPADHAPLGEKEAQTDKSGFQKDPGKYVPDVEKTQPYKNIDAASYRLRAKARAAGETSKLGARALRDRAKYVEHKRRQAMKFKEEGQVELQKQAEADYKAEIEAIKQQRADKGKLKYTKFPTDLAKRVRKEVPADLQEAIDKLEEVWDQIHERPQEELQDSLGFFDAHRWRNKNALEYLRDDLEFFVESTYPELKQQKTEKEWRKRMREFDNSQQRTEFKQLAEKWLAGLGIEGDVKMATPEEAMATMMLQGLGLDEMMSVGGFSNVKGDTVEVYVNPFLPKAAQIEVVGHELGHVVFQKAFSDLGKKQKQEVMAAFEQWRQQLGASATLSDAMVQTIPVNMLEAYLGNMGEGGNAKLSDLTEESRAYFTDFEEWFANNTAKWLNSEAEPRSVVEQFFAHVADLIRTLSESITGNKADEAVAKFLDSLWRPQVRQTVNQEQFREVFAHMEKQLGVEAHPADLVSTAAFAQENLFGEMFNKSMHKLLEGTLGERGGIITAQEKAILMRAFKSKANMRRLRELVAKDPKALHDIANSPAAAVAYGFQFWVTGEFSLGPQSNSVFQKMLDKIKEVLGYVKDSDNAQKILEAFYKGKLKARAQGVGEFVVQERLRETQLQRAVRTMEKASEPIAALVGRVILTTREQIVATRNPWLIQMMDQIHTPVGAEGHAEGMLAARTHKRGEFEERLHTIFDEKDKAFGERVVNIMNGLEQAETSAEKEAVKKLRGLLNRIFNYEVEAGVFSGEENRIKQDYFPRVVDVEYLQKNHDKFIEMLMQDKYSSEVESAAIAERIYQAYINNMGDGETAAADMIKEGLGMPKANSANKREFGWIEKEDLAPFLSKDLGLTMSTYINQMVKRAEYVRRFEDGKGMSFDKYIEKARAAGATKADIKVATKAMQGVMGTLGADIDPRLQTIQGGLMVFQNFAVLALSTLTSIVDPVGIAVRGDLNTAYHGFKEGMKATIAEFKKEKNGLASLAKGLGTIEQLGAMEALGFEYGGYYVTGKAKVWNERLFRFNGLQSWTRTTRLMALAGAQHFIAKHGNFQFNKHSKRFMEQLGLRKGDVKLDANGELQVLLQSERRDLQAKGEAGRAELERDDRIRVALNRFVDQAILRPDAAQRPIWANDPHWMLVFHLKSFTYSFHDRILKRVFSELGEGNYSPMLYLMGYVPIMAAADITRNIVQGDDDDGPDDFLDMIDQSMQRAGLYGVTQFGRDAMQDVAMGRTGFESLAGPTAGHAMQLIRAMNTASTSDDKNAVIRGLPLQNVWKDWGMFQ